MLIQVNPHKIVLIKTNDVNSGEYNVNECTFEFSQEFDNLTCIAVFSLCDGTTKNITILNNRCIIPTEVLTQTGQVKIGVYGYSVQDDELVLRYSPAPQIFVVTEGSYKEGTEPVAPTPTDWEILVEQVSDNSRDISNIKEDITGINGEISGINIDIRDLQDTKANINDLSAVAFSGSYNDLINKPNLSVYATKTDLSDEATLRENADVSLQEQIDAISVSSDVVDVVGTYQELLNYDTQHLKDNDIVKVLVDSTHNDALSYYRWDKESQTWSYIGSEGPFYTKAETRELLNAKEDKITTTNKLDADLVDDSNSTNKFVTEEDITYWDNKEDKSNKVTEINSSSTDTQYPSAKCVYYSQEEQNEHIAELEMLYNAFPTVSDEDTTIQLDNTAKVKFREIDLKGNTSQVVIPEEQGTSVSNTSIYVSDVDTDKEHTIEMSGNTYQETTSISGGDEYDSPSPEHPQNIEVVTGTNTIKINGKNLFDLSNITTGKTFTNTGAISSLTNSFIQEIYIPVSSETDYTMSTTNDYSSETDYRLVICEYDSNKNFIKRNSGGSAVGNKYTITTSSTTKYVRLCASIVTLNELQFEENSTASEYEPYKEQSYTINLGSIELCKISTYQDRIYKQNDKWYLYKEIGKVVLDGTQDIYKVLTGTTGYYRYNVDIGTNIFTTDSISTVAPFYCNRLVSGTRGNTFSIIECIAPSTTNYSYKSFNLYIEAISQMTVEQVNTWFSNNNTIVYYPYATPTTTEITDTTLVSQLNALYNATIYPITNINTETSNLLPYIDLHYNFVTPSPSPNRPSIVNVVKGNNTITISNSDNTESQNYPINLGDIELCKIGTYQDYIYESNGNWFKKNNVKVATDIIGSTSKTISDMVSNATIYSYCGGTVSGTTITYTSELLVANTIYYPTTTPTDTQITDTTLITQLNNIKKAYSYDTQTNISQTNTDKPFIIYAEAIRSLKDVFE